MVDHSAHHLAWLSNCGQAWHTIVFFAAIVSSSGVLIFAADMETQISGAIRRAKAIQSGRLVYRVESGVTGSKVIGPQRLPAKILSFLGSDWIERDREMGSILISRGKSFMQLDQIRQEDGKVRSTAVLSPAHSFKDPGQENHRPWFAGSFWHAAQLEHVEQHRTEFRRLPSGNVDGVPCEICELDVSGENAVSAFQLFTPLLNSGGTLRLHIAPQLGFVLPLVEFYAHSGVRAVAYEAKDWLEFPGQLHFPRQIRKELLAPSGVIEYEQFTIEPTLIGQPIPDSEFVVEIPAGTRVQDKREGTRVRRFLLTPPATWQELVGPDPDRPSPAIVEPSRFPSRLIWLAAAVLLIAIVCCLLALRRLRTR